MSQRSSIYNISILVFLDLVQNSSIWYSLIGCDTVINILVKYLGLRGYVGVDEYIELDGSTI